MRKETGGCGRAVFWAVGWLVLLLGCRSGTDTGKPRVVCSLFPLHEFARAVAGDRAGVSLLLPPGVEPHAWEPRASDLVAIEKADLFLCVSGELEPWARDIVQGVRGKGLKVIEASEGFKAPGDPGAEPRDPHVWLDLGFDQGIVQRIAGALTAIDPDGGARYRANAAAYNRKLQELDARYRQGLAQCRHRRLILGGHSAFSYLARRYGLQEIPLYGVSADAEPTPKKLAEVVEAARAQKVKYVFLETLISPKIGEVVAREVGAETLLLNPGANLTTGQFEAGVTFLSILEGNLVSLRKGLECEG